MPPASQKCSPSALLKAAKRALLLLSLLSTPSCFNTTVDPTVGVGDQDRCPGIKRRGTNRTPIAARIVDEGDAEQILEPIAEFQVTALAQ